MLFPPKRVSPLHCQVNHNVLGRPQSFCGRIIALVENCVKRFRDVQHSAHIEPGREGLFNLIESLPPRLKYEPGTIVAAGDFVVVHGRFSGFGAPVNWIAADILRIQDGILAEHWDAFRTKPLEEQSKSKAPMVWWPISNIWILTQAD